MTMRVTIFMSRRHFGFSETYWHDGDTLDSVISWTNSLLTNRNRLLPESAAIGGVRISVEGKPRMGRVFKSEDNQVGVKVLHIPVAGGGVGFSGTNPDQARACLNLAVINAGRSLGIRYFTMIPDTITTTEVGGVFMPGSPAWATAFGQFRTGLTAGGWKIKVLKGQGPPGELKVLAYGIQAGPPNNLQVLVDGGPGLAVDVGSTVILRGVRMTARGVRSPNGHWEVASTVTGGTPLLQTITLRSSSAFDPSLIKKLGFIRLKDYEYLLIEDLIPAQVGTHKRGGPFGQLRGRRLIRV